MRAWEKLEKQTRALDTIIKNLGTTVGTMGSVQGLSKEVAETEDGLQARDPGKS